DSAPCTGENTNCISMYSVPNAPTHTAALAMLPPISCTMSCGSTGITMPNASVSSITVTKMKASAAWWRGEWVEGDGGMDVAWRGSAHDSGTAPSRHLPWVQVSPRDRPSRRLHADVPAAGDDCRRGE